MGGTKIVVKGIEFWTNESPPWKLAILRVVASEIEADYGDEAFIRSPVATRAQEVDGGAVIHINDIRHFGLGPIRICIYAGANAWKEEFCGDVSGIGVETY